MTRYTLAELNRMDEEAFTEALGGIFEHSPWVARGAWPARPFDSVEELHRAMVRVVRSAGAEKVLELARAHPDLAGSAWLSGRLSEDSMREQAGAGLGRITPEQQEQFLDLNRRYRERFGFPFIVAVKGKTPEAILEAFAARLHNSPDAELETALAEIEKIAYFRLMEGVLPA